MLSAIQEHLREQTLTPSELTELMFIDNQFETISAEDMKGLEQYENLEFVNFAEVGLNSVAAPFPALKSCGAVLFSNNNLSNGVLETLVNLESLESLALDGNKISSLEKFELLAGLAKLKEISLADCPVTETADYREKLFAILPQVQIIDDMDREGNVIELDSEDDEDFSDDSEGIDDEDLAELGELVGSDLEDEDDDEDEDDEDEEDEEDSEEPVSKKTRN
jgi:hypothetical protein